MERTIREVSNENRPAARDEADWQQFALEQLFREEDDVTYTLAEAREVYHP